MFGSREATLLLESKRFGQNLAGSDLLKPFSLAYTKGWRRSTTLLIILAGVKDLEMDLEELPAVFKDWVLQ